MTKITPLTDLVNLENQTTAVNAINANNASIETAFDNTISRDGSVPNTMLAGLDMNSNQIFNLPAPSTVNSPARLIDVVSNPTITIPGQGTSGHVVPFLDGNNTWSGTNTHSANVTLNSTSTFNGVATMTSPVFITPALGTPASGTLTNCSIPVAGVSGLGAGVGTFLATPSSANLATAVTGETGTGALVFATTPTLVTPVLGAATGTSVTVTGNIRSSGATSGIGYNTGSGGLITQQTSKVTGVSLNTMCGDITTHNAALAANTTAAFLLNNTNIGLTDFVQVHLTIGGAGVVTGSAYNVWVDRIQANAATICIRNITAGSLGEAVAIRFIVFKAVTS